MWNFIGRDHDEIVGFRDQWQRDVIGGSNPADGSGPWKATGAVAAGAGAAGDQAQASVMD